MDIRKGPPGGFRQPQFGPFEIGDARPLQAEARSEAEFFGDHGFALLQHETAVRDWDADPPTVYYPEIDRLVRERLYPDKRVDVHQWSPPLRRGRETGTPQYANGVHSDYGLTPDDFQVSVEAFANAQAAAGWRRAYDRDEVEAFIIVDFWRTTNMSGPLLHMPIALCDPTTVDISDLVPTSLTGVAPFFS